MSKRSLMGSMKRNFLANRKDGKLLLSGSNNFVLPQAGNDELCAKLQTLMLENVFDETEKEQQHATNKIP